jgi:hypothetical protein
MKVGDMVRLVVAEPAGQSVWIIRSLKSDARGIWLQFLETPDDTWHAGSSYEAINESW